MANPAKSYESAMVRAMSYYPKPRNGYRVLLATASGTELDRFIIQLTMRGIEPDEPAQEIGSVDDTAHAGVYLFTPKPH